MLKVGPAEGAFPEVALKPGSIVGDDVSHTPPYWHLPPKSARIGYTTEGALFTSKQMSTNAVSAL